MTVLPEPNDNWDGDDNESHVDGAGETTYIKKFLAGTDIADRLEYAITTAVTENFEAYNPHFVSSFDSWAVYSQTIQKARDSLAIGFDFRVERSRNQERLLSLNDFFAPVRLRFARGKLLTGGGCIVLNAAKGRETQTGLSQNYQHFGKQIPLYPLKQVYSVVEEKILNLWVVYEFSGDEKWLNAWLALCTEPLSDTILNCHEYITLCSKSFDSTLDTIDKPDSPDFDFDIEERGKDVG